MPIRTHLRATAQRWRRGRGWSVARAWLRSCCSIPAQTGTQLVDWRSGRRGWRQAAWASRRGRARCRGPNRERGQRHPGQEKECQGGSVSKYIYKDNSTLDRKEGARGGKLVKNMYTRTTPPWRGRRVPGVLLVGR